MNMTLWLKMNRTLYEGQIIHTHRYTYQILLRKIYKYIYNKRLKNLYMLLKYA